MARPGLTAHASAYRSAHRYRPSGTAHAGGGARVVPSRFSWINLGLEFVDPRLSIEDPGPSPADCELDCGEQRADCFREGGTRAECDQAQQECLWDCFFGDGEVVA
jgi:hypothetical protein